MNKLVFKSKDNKMIFHPGYFNQKYNGWRRERYKRYGTVIRFNRKEITALINAEINITDDMIW